MYSLSPLDRVSIGQEPSATSQFPNDPRYSAINSSYPSSALRMSSSIPYDSPNIPVTATHQGQYHPQEADTASSIISSTHIRSLSLAGYPSQYTYGTQPQQASYYASSNLRSMSPGIASMTYDPSGASISRRSSMSVDHTVPSHLLRHGLPSYAHTPPVIPSANDQEPLSEPVIKKKRKRACR